MDREMTFLLIEDDQNACDEIEHYIDGVEDVKLVGVTNDSNKGLEMVQTYLPDVVILDLELHLGGGNGLYFLLGLGRLELSYRPYILVTTHNASEVTLETARQFGADFILTKYESGYSAQYVIESARMLKNVIFERTANKRTPANPLTPAEKEHKLIARIQRELDLIGVSPKNIGYQYLTDAILLTIQKQNAGLSRTLADKYHKTDTSIERAMQNAINRTWKTSDTEDLLKHYTSRIRSDKGVPTLMEFIYYYANKIKMEIE